MLPFHERKHAVLCDKIIVTQGPLAVFFFVFLSFQPMGRCSAVVVWPKYKMSKHQEIIMLSLLKNGVWPQMWTSSLDFLRLSTSSCSTTSDPPLSSFDRVLVSCLSPWNVHTAVITQLQASTQVCQQRCFGVLMFQQGGHWENYIIYINQIKSNVGRFSVCVLCSWGECGQAVVCDHGHASSKAVNYHAITALEQCVMSDTSKSVTASHE